MITLDEAREHIGEEVVYLSPDGVICEPGVITSVNTAYVFVRYGVNVRATPPQCLEWAR